MPPSEEYSPLGRVGELLTRLGLMRPANPPVPEDQFPPTLAQQRELARRRVPYAAKTRRGAALYISYRRNAEDEEARQAWERQWTERGVQVHDADAAPVATCRELDDAWEAVTAAGLAYVLPREIHSGDVRNEAARMRLALDLPRAVARNARRLHASGRIGRELRREEADDVVRVCLRLLRGDPAIPFDVKITLAAIAAVRPGILAQPWQRRELVAGLEGWVGEQG